MPPKRPFRPENTDPILDSAKASMSSLLLTRSLLSNCYKQTDDLHKDIETIIRLHRKFQRELKEDIKEKS
jgi:hypothetical protein